MNNKALKKTVGIIIVSIMFLGSSSVLSASEESSNYILSIENTFITLTTNKLTLNPNGTLNCIAQTSVMPKFTAGVLIELQQNDNGSWTTIKKWRAKNDDTVKIDETVCVKKGYLYRIQTVHASYYNNKLCETFIKPGNTVKR